MWAQMLTENFGVTDAYKKAWVAEYASVHEIHESALGMGGGNMMGANGVPVTAPAQGVSPLYATPLNTLGMGNPMAPGYTANGQIPMGGSADFFKQSVGSGEMPISTLPMALNVALMTIGLELVPVIPAKGPWAMLTYMDFPYAGGKMGGKNEIVGLDGRGEGAENKPLYFKVLIPVAAIGEARTKLVEGDTVTFTTNAGVVTGTFKTIGRMDGGIICQIVSCVDKAETSKPISLKEAFVGAVTIAGGNYSKEFTAADAVSVDFAQTHVDFVDGFANFFDGSKKPMSRAENETGTGNVLGLRLFSKWIQMGSYEVTATVTRQQLQDLPLYGVDAVSKVMEACQNEITQSINARILEHVFALGVTNAIQMKARQNADFNLYMGTAASKNLSQFGVKPFMDINGIDQTGHFDNIKNAEVNSSAENTYTRQRRISSRILAAANLIQVTGRRGRANWVVTNAQVATALQDCSGYVVAPMVNTFSQDGSKDLYQAGTLAGIKVYVDPYMDWDDCRICVGRKGNGNEPGVIFMPYILADTVSITAEGTMAPKMLVNSRYAIADAGFFPEKMYYTFAVNSDFGLM